MLQLDQSLSQQLGITELEISHRKQLLDFTRQDVEILLKFKPLFSRYMDGIVKQFYDRQVKEPEIALAIGDAETLRRLQGAMRSYIIELFQGVYELDYVNRRLRIGKIHQRIGVSPKLYISAVYLLQKIMHQVIRMHFYDEAEREDIRLLKDALNKLFMFDVQLVFETYIHSLVSEVETAKTQLQIYTTSLEDEITRRTHQLEDMTRKDDLTGLLNHRGLLEALSRELASAERHQDRMTIAYFDLNDFKTVNDEEGHYAGDMVLQKVSEAINSSIRQTDYASRHGGDEFCILFPRTGIEEAHEVIQRMVETHQHVCSRGITFSIGLATTGPDEFVDMDSLLNMADKRMYAAKACHRERPGYYLMDHQQSKLLAAK